MAWWLLSVVVAVVVASLVDVALVVDMHTVDFVDFVEIVVDMCVDGSKGVRAVKGVKGVKKGKLIIKSLSSVIKGIIIFWNFLQKCERKLPQK